MAKKAATYKIRYLQGGRWRVRPTNMRLVTKFEVWYGKRRILSPQEFPKVFKSAGDRRDFLFDLVKSVEIRRQKFLEERRRRYKKKRDIDDRTYSEERMQRKLRKKVDLSTFDREWLRQGRENRSQRLVFEEVRALKPIEAQRAYVKDTLQIPIAPDGKTYVKEVIDKEMSTRGPNGDYHLSILNFTLNEEHHIPMTAETFQEAFDECEKMLLPSALDYFQQVKKSAELFIFRIKFLNNWDPDAPYSDYGISYYRTQLRDDTAFVNLFRQTFFMLFGAQGAWDKTTRNMLRANYLSGEKLIFITGFTLEASDL